MPDTQEGREQQAREAERRRIRREIEEAIARRDERRREDEGTGEWGPNTDTESEEE